MLQTLKVTFYLYLHRANSRGEAPIYCKITLGEDRQQFSTSIHINPEIWDKKSQRAKGISDNTMLVNRKLQEIHSQFIKIEKQLYDEGSEVSIKAIYNRYKGKESEHTLGSVFNERIAKSVFPQSTIQICVVIKSATPVVMWSGKKRKRFHQI